MSVKRLLRPFAFCLRGLFADALGGIGVAGVGLVCSIYCDDAVDRLCVLDKVSSGRGIDLIDSGIGFALCIGAKVLPGVEYFLVIGINCQFISVWIGVSRKLRSIRRGETLLYSSQNYFLVAAKNRSRLGQLFSGGPIVFAALGQLKIPLGSLIT